MTDTDWKFTAEARLEVIREQEARLSRYEELEKVAQYHPHDRFDNSDDCAICDALRGLKDDRLARLAAQPKRVVWEPEAGWPDTDLQTEEVK